MSDSTESPLSTRGSKVGCDEIVYKVNLRATNNQAAPPPCTSDPVKNSYETKGYTMSLKRGTKQITLFRFLLAKLVYGREHEGLSLEEYLALYEVYFSLQESRDPNTLQKWKDSLSRVSPVLVGLSEFKEFPIVLDADSRVELSKHLWSDPILPQPEAFFGLMGNRELRNSFRIKFRSEWIPRKRVERYIGVGYKDKGNCRVPSFDGTPSWQRVATVLCNQEREAEDPVGTASPVPPDGAEGSD